MMGQMTKLMIDEVNRSKFKGITQNLKEFNQKEMLDVKLAGLDPSYIFVGHLFTLKRSDHSQSQQGLGKQAI